MIGLVFLGLSRLGANKQRLPLELLKKACAVLIVAGAGSIRYYCGVLGEEGLVKKITEPRFAEVCRLLENTKNNRVFLCENDVLLTPWLCYHARHGEIFVDGNFISPSGLSRTAG